MDTRRLFRRFLNFRVSKGWLLCGIGGGLLASAYGRNKLDRNFVFCATHLPIGGTPNSGKLIGGSETSEACLAVYEGKLSLLENLSVDQLSEKGVAGVSALMLASFLGAVTPIEILLSRGVSVEDRSEPPSSISAWHRYFPNYEGSQGLRAAEFAVLGAAPEKVVTRLISLSELPVESVPPSNSPSDSIWEGGFFSPHGGRMGPQRKQRNVKDPKDPKGPYDRFISLAQAAHGLNERQQHELRRAVREGIRQQEARKRSERAEFPLEARLAEHIVGQTAALKVVANAVRRKENGWTDSDAPLVLLLMGSSGIGKTETAKRVAAYLHGSAEAAQKCFIRVDMSEFQQKHEASKFVGAPPGYVGYTEGGQLTKKLMECPNAVVLLDEVEKAHPDVLATLLQTFDEGRLTDGQGETVHCTDAVFVMTSNLAQREIAAEALRLRNADAPRATQNERPATPDDTDGLRDDAKQDIRQSFARNVIHGILRQHFKRDEFIGRINEIVFFLPFTQEEQRQLAERELRRWAVRTEARHRIQLSWDPEVAARVAEAYDVRYGARSIKYEIDRLCIGALAQAYETNRLREGEAARLRLANDAENEIDVVVSERTTPSIGPSETSGGVRELAEGAKRLLRHVW